MNSNSPGDFGFDFVTLLPHLYQLVSYLDVLGFRDHSIMPPNKVDAPRDAVAADWTELRQTLVVLHEDLQRTLQRYIMELGETLINRMPATNPLFEELEHDDHNPFARVNQLGDNANVNYNRYGYQAARVDQTYNRWEMAFKVDIPEFHGGGRSDVLLDWMVSVEEILEFKQVPEERRIPLVAM